MTLSGIAGELLSPAAAGHKMPAEGWQQWKRRDEQVSRSNNNNSSNNKFVSHTADGDLLLIDVPFTNEVPCKCIKCFSLT